MTWKCLSLGNCVHPQKFLSRLCTFLDMIICPWWGSNYTRWFIGHHIGQIERAILPFLLWDGQWLWVEDLVKITFYLRLILPVLHSQKARNKLLCVVCYVECKGLLPYDRLTLHSPNQKLKVGISTKKVSKKAIFNVNHVLRLSSKRYHWSQPRLKGQSSVVDPHTRRPFMFLLGNDWAFN